MLSIVSARTITQCPSLYLSQFRLRHRQFIERQKYDVKIIEDMEFDEYDTLVSAYLVYSEDGKTALGCSRLTPVAYGCMLKDHFPDLIEDHSIFDSDRTWEGTRFCIDNALPADKRRHILQQLAVGYLEFGLSRGADRIIGLMPTLILRSVFVRNGITLTPLGPVRAIGIHSKIQAAAIEISEDTYLAACAVTGITRPLGLIGAQGQVRDVA